jgi:hypothetical protein
VKPETIEIKNNTNGVSIENEEEQESRGDFHDFDYEPDDISFLKPPSQIGTPEPLIYKTECLLDLILQELIQIRNKLN